MYGVTYICATALCFLYTILTSTSVVSKLDSVIATILSRWYLFYSTAY